MITYHCYIDDLCISRYLQSVTYTFLVIRGLCFWYRSRLVTLSGKNWSVSKISLSLYCTKYVVSTVKKTGVLILLKY